MAENFVNILREIRGNTLAPATDRDCIYGDIKWMYGVIEGYQQITPEERLKLENIEEEATKNSTDGFLLSRANHTGTMSMAYTTDSTSRFAMTTNDRNKLNAMIPDATKNDSDANLRNRATHTGTQSIDTLFNSSTHVKMTTDERSKLTAIQTNATKNATDAELRDRSTHTGTQSADTIVNGVTNAAFTNEEKVKLAVLDITKPPAHFHEDETINSLSYGKLINVPHSFTPSEHLHDMNEITLGNLDASRINESFAQQFVSHDEKDRISGSEQAVNKGVPNGYAPLDGNGKINPSYLDSLNVIDVFTPVDYDAMLLLSSAKPGDIAYVQSFQDTYMLIALPSDNHLNWKKLNSAAGVISINGLNGVVSMSSDDLPEGIENKYYTEDRVTDRVKDFIKAGTNVTVSYDSITNELTISANDTSVEWSEIQNKPSPNISVEITGDASGSANTTLTELASGSIEINNLTLNDTGTAGTYRKVTTDSKGRVVSGEGATTIAEYEITDAYTKTEIENSLPSIGLDENNISIPTKSGQIKYNKTDGTTNLMLENGFIYKAGLEQIKQVENSHTSTITKGTVLVTDGKSGTTGNTSVYPCSGNVLDYSKIYGIAAQDITVGNTGYCYTVGKISNINTTGTSQGETWEQGDVLYVKQSGNGVLTNVEPEQGQLRVAIAFVEIVGVDGTINIPGSAYMNETYSKKELNLGQLDNRYYTETELDNGVLDTRYYTESEIDAKLAEQNDADEINYDGTISGLVATNVQDAIDEAEGRLGIAETAISNANLTRADKYLASQNVVKMIYNLEGKLSKVRYNNDTDVDYEILTYNLDGKLNNVAHFIDSILRGNTTLNYENGKLVAAPYITI